MQRGCETMWEQKDASLDEENFKLMSGIYKTKSHIFFRI